MSLIYLVVLVVIIGLAALLFIGSVNKSAGKIAAVVQGLGMQLTPGSPGSLLMKGRVGGKDLTYTIVPPAGETPGSLVVTLFQGSPLLMTVVPQGKMTAIKSDTGAGRDAQVGDPVLDGLLEIDAVEGPALREFFKNPRVRSFFLEFGRKGFQKFRVTQGTVIYKQVLTTDTFDVAPLMKINEELAAVASVAASVGRRFLEGEGQGAHEDSAVGELSPKRRVRYDGSPPSEGGTGPVYAAAPPPAQGGSGPLPLSASVIPVPSASAPSPPSASAPSPPSASAPSPPSASAPSPPSTSAPPHQSVAGAVEGDVESWLRDLETGGLTAEQVAARLRGAGGGEADVARCVERLSEYSMKDKVGQVLVALGRDAVEPLLAKAGDYLLSHEIREVLSSLDASAKELVASRLDRGAGLDRKKVEFLLDWVGREKRTQDIERVARFLGHEDIGVRMQAERALRELGVSNIQKLKAEHS